jgi:membrane protein
MAADSAVATEKSGERRHRRRGAMDALNTERRRDERNRGRSANRPTQVPPQGWQDILWRTWKEMGDDRLTLVAAGATYYLLLAIFPTLTAFVSLYGLIADPRTVAEHVELVSSIVPAGGIELIREQLTRLTEQGNATLGLALVISVAIALWSSSTGVKTMFEAMNIAFDEREERGFIKLNLLALAFTLGGIVGSLLMVGVVVVLPMVLGFLGLSRGLEWLVQGIGYLLVAGLLFVGLLLLYRFGPDRQQAKWRWLLPGAAFAVVGVLVASLLFSWYSANFANYDKTYGSLGALIGFLTWIWISVIVVLLGAELNAELEHQTARDTTIGADAPMGQRDATMADTLGRSLKEGGEPASDALGAERKEQAGGIRHPPDSRGARQRVPRRIHRRSPVTLVLAVPLALAAMMRERRKGRRTSASNA